MFDSATTRRLLAVAVITGAAACTSGPPQSPRTTSPRPLVSQSTQPASLGGKATPSLTPARPFVLDLTWISDSAGWALAATPCSQGLCSEVMRTGDGGRTWVGLPRPPVVINDSDDVECSRDPCVSHIRFATSSVGYLFGPALFMTTDGGRHWHRQAGPSVESVEPGPGNVVRVVYATTGCPGPCHQSVQEAPVGSSTWRTLLRIPDHPAPGRVEDAQAIRQGTGLVYVPVYGSPAAGAGIQHTVIWRSVDGGTTWRALDDPCGRGAPAYPEYDGSALAAAGGFLAALCEEGDTGHPAFVITSVDEGSSWGLRYPIPAIWAGAIAAASPTRLVIASAQLFGTRPSTFRLAVSTDGGLRWNSVVSDREQIDPAAPLGGFLGFEDSSVGRWIADERWIWSTRDGGIHWTRLPFP